MKQQLAITSSNPADNFRLSTDVAGICKEIVTKTALQIQGKKYVRVEGWESIALAHGCVPSVNGVERVEGGYRALAELKKADGTILATAEGFVGEDEPTWFGGESNGRILSKRPDYAIRAMTQTRAISRVCRSVFAHVVVLMDADLETTPADEVPFGEFDNDREERRQGARESKAKKVRDLQDADPYGHHGEIPALPEKQEFMQPHMSEPATDWREVKIHFGKNAGTPLGSLTPQSLHWYSTDWVNSKLGENGNSSTRDDKVLIGALMQYRRMKSEQKAEVQA